MPACEPIHAQAIERSRSSAATARPELVYPPMPPPAMTTSAVTALPSRALALMSLESERDQAVDQIGVGETGGRPHLGVGAGRREARDGVDLVHQHPVGPALDEEVDAGHARAVDGAEGRDREFL